MVLMATKDDLSLGVKDVFAQSARAQVVPPGMSMVSTRMNASSMSALTHINRFIDVPGFGPAASGH